MPKYAWMCLYKQGSKYATGCKYVKFLTAAKFWMWQLHSVLNMPEHALTEFRIYLKLQICHELRIWQGS